MAAQASPIATLLRLVPTNPSNVLSSLQTSPALASAADENGYTLLHAAASYNALELLRALVTVYKANVNITDEDGETPLFVAETEAAAQCLVEELDAQVTAVNHEGINALENAQANAEDEGGAWVAVAAYLQAKVGGGQDAAVNNSDPPTGHVSANYGSEDVHPPPPLPPGVRLNVDTVGDAYAQGDQQEPDPEFRRRIEELAARDDFQGEEGQTELRRLVSEAIGGLSTERSNVRRRVE